MLRIWSIFLREGRVYVPTEAQAASGFFVSTEPIDVVDPSDKEALVKAITRVLTAGNPRVPNPSAAELRKPELFALAGVKSDKAFERGTLFWKIRELDGQVGIIPGLPHKEGGWLDDESRAERLGEGASVEEIAQRAAALVIQAAKSAL